MDMPQTVFSTCPHDCPSQCALEIERLDEQTIGRVRGAKTQRYTDGVVCAKVARYAERVHHPDRLTTPLLKQAGGGFAPIGWDDALDLVAEKFVQATQSLGSEAVWPYYYAGTMGRVQRDGINRLRHVMRYSGMKKTICTGTVHPGWKAGVGAFMGASPYEMAEADMVILWGTNAVATQVNVMNHVSRARKNHGAKLIVVDPYRNGSAEVADQHICLRPGTDGALAVAMMHVLFAEGYADRDYMARYTDVPDKLEEHLKTRTPEWAARITGLSVEEIVGFARAYGATERAFIRVGYGFSRSRNGAANVHAVSCLPSVTGKWLVPGGGAFFSNSDIYHLDSTLIEGLDAIDPSVRTLDMSRIGPVLTGDKRDLGDGPPVTAMLIQSTNPVVVAPEHNLVRQGFARDDLFVCVHEQFMTETAEAADLVLPATTFLEHDDFYIGGGHSYLQLGLQAIAPLAEARSNHEVLQGIAARVGAEHPGFGMTARELVDATLRASGWPEAAAWDDNWIDCMPDFDTAHFVNGFPHDDGKFHFAPRWADLGPDAAVMPPLPDHQEVIEEIDDAHPLRMVTAPARSYLNSSFTETPTSTKREGRPKVMIHPDTAAGLGVTDEALVVLGNKRGEVKVHAQLFDGVQPDVVVVEGIWPNKAFVDGIGINALTGADSPPPNGGATFHDTAVWLKTA